MRQHVSPSTWCAFAAVVGLLGALGLLVIGCNQAFKINDTTLAHPNFYVCEATCSKGEFVVGARVQTTVMVNVSGTPGGAFIGEEAAGSDGTIIAGPGSPQASNEIWWQVRFDDNLTGWVARGLLVVTDGGLIVQKSLDVCSPPAWNPYLGGNTHPGPSEISDDCRGRVAQEFLAQNGSELPPGTFCQFDATSTIDFHDSSCEVACTDPSGVCVVMGWDPQPPAPDPVSAAVFQTTTVCQVQGTIDLTVGGHKPKNSPTGARGVAHILGRPCPGQSCQVGLAYQLTVDDIEFDSGTIFADDPKFVDISVQGSTAPDAISLGFLLFNLGPLPAGAALNTVEGRQSGDTNSRTLIFRNDDAVGSDGSGGLAVSWGEHGACRLFGNFGGKVVDTNSGDTLDVSAVMDMNGSLLNQPPHVDTSKTAKTVECTSPNGATVTLDGSGSTDPDKNITFYAWRRGSETGPHVADPSTTPTVTTQQALGQTTYDLRVADSFLAADHDTVTVNVVDTTAPTISCNAPATITPNDIAPVSTAPSTVPQKPQQGLSFKATASDACNSAPQLAVTGYACSKSSCRVAVSGDTITILDSGGVGDTISWTVSANDGAGNPTQKTCQVNVINK